MSNKKTDREEPSIEEVAAGYCDFVGGGVAEWHFPMMNDVERNTAYEKALGTALKKGGVVLDIGSGSGLLAMIAARQGATQVITCEQIPIIARKAVEIIKKNGYAERIRVINKLSTELVPEKDLPQLADVLVAEIFDDGLLGEKAFSTFAHARQNLLKPGAQIIPAGARVIGMCIETQDIFERHRVSQAAGFDVSAFNEFAVNNYTGYHLDRFSYRPLTDKKVFFDFDFRQSYGEGLAPLEFAVQSTGLCHAVAYWFELQLDADTVVNTGPGKTRHSSWKQAVRLLDEPIQLKQGDVFKLLAHHDSENIWFSRK